MRQEVEAQALAEQRRTREESLAEQLAGDDDPMRDALCRLVEQIEGSGYENEAGPLEMNAAFIEVRELLRGYVGR